MYVEKNPDFSDNVKNVHFSVLMRFLCKTTGTKNIL